MLYPVVGANNGGASLAPAIGSMNIEPKNVVLMVVVPFIPCRSLISEKLKTVEVPSLVDRCLNLPATPNILLLNR